KSQQAYISTALPEPMLAFKVPEEALANEIVGLYVDPWFGEVDIAREQGKLVLRSAMSPILTGELEYLDDSVFVVKWFDRTLEADAYVRFERDFEGRISSVKMQAVSSETDSSFDFHDLDFKPVAGE
ncbi:MAG: DUF3471 domain-containing protein, partial [Gammaproteobacteria bacterium]|nr:DUF3471 domain-containing protein [Gammaproteobacteria bacterium]